MVFLWCSALAAVVVVATQSAARTWIADFWAGACLVLAIAATVGYRIARKRQKRWDAGDYDD